MDKLQAARQSRRALQLFADTLTDTQALEIPLLYPAWEAETAYGGEGHSQIVSRPDGHLYRCQQAHTSQEGWEPENTPALWVVIANTEAGTLEDPITAARGMEYQYGLYYRIRRMDRLTYVSALARRREGRLFCSTSPMNWWGNIFPRPKRTSPGAA